MAKRSFSPKLKTQLATNTQQTLVLIDTVKAEIKAFNQFVSEWNGKKAMLNELESKISQKTITLVEAEDQLFDLTKFRDYAEEKMAALDKVREGYKATYSNLSQAFVAEFRPNGK